MWFVRGKAVLPVFTSPTNQKNKTLNFTIEKAKSVFYKYRNSDGK